MKKLVYISFIFSLLVGFASCEKELIEPNEHGVEDCGSGTRGQQSNHGDGATSTGGVRGDETLNGGGSITDPDDDEDFDADEKGGITDPDDDEDFDEDEDGK